MRPGGGVHRLFNTTGVPGGPVLFSPAGENNDRAVQVEDVVAPGRHAIVRVRDAATVGFIFLRAAGERIVARVVIGRVSHAAVGPPLRFG